MSSHKKSDNNRIPLGVHVLRAGFRLLYAIAPPIAGRVATTYFLRARTDGPKAAHTPLGARKLKLKDPDGDLGKAYVWGSEGPRVLLIHGWGADSSAMFSMAERLSEAGYRVFAFDGPAHGTAPGGSWATMTDYVNAIRKVLRQLGEIDTIVAHSLGGIAAVSAVALEKAPRRMALISAPCDLPLVLDRWAGFFRMPAGLVDRIRADLWRRNGVPVEHWDLRQRGAELDCPVLLLHDRKDILVPSDEAATAASVLPRATYELTDGLGHRRILLERSVQDRVAAFAAERTPGADSAPVAESVARA